MDSGTRVLIEQAIEQANDRLLKARSRVKIQCRGKGDWLYLRATLPPKKGQGTRPFQQRIALNMQATEKAIEKAESLAMKLGAQLNLNEFDWADWCDLRPPKTVEDWVALLEQQFWEDRDERNPAHHETWRVGYLSVLRRLPLNRELTPDLLRQWVPPKDSSGSYREHYVARANQLAEMAGLEIRFKNVPRSRPRNKRDLPTDDRLVELYESLSGSDQWVIGVLVAYGLRGHELFGLDYSQYPVLRVRKTAKTGSRLVVPICPEGAKWDLSVQRIPSTWVKATADQDWEKPTRSNSSMGTMVTRLFRRRGWGMTPYDIRHAFNQRCKYCGLDEFLAARLMGHTQRVNRDTYQYSFSDQLILDMVNRALQ